MTHKSLIERAVERIENPKKAQVDKLRENGLGGYILDKAIFNTLGGIVGLGVTVGLAALAGEVMDHIPYISTAVPEAIRGLTNSEYFYGNLDKLGATLGFVGKYIKR